MPGDLQCSCHPWEGQHATDCPRAYLDVLSWMADRLAVSGYLALPCRACGRHGTIGVHALHEAMRAAVRADS